MEEKVMKVPSTAEKWLKKLSKTRFTILVFYRGKWCPQCMNYLKSVNEILDKINTLNGKVYAVCAQDIEKVKETHEYLGLNYTLLSDEKNILAKHCKVEITEKKSSLFQSFLHVLKKSYPDAVPYMESLKYDNGMSEPAVIVLDSKHKVMFNWKKYPSFANFYGAYGRLPISEVLSVIEYQLSPTFLEMKSKIKVKKGQISDLFNEILKELKLQKMFADHLKREYCSEMLEFILDIENWRNSPSIEKSDKATYIYNTYLADFSPKEVNIPSNIKHVIIDLFTSNSSLNNDLNKEITDIFHDAFIHVKHTLFSDPFKRFQDTPSFFNLIKELPQYFEV